MKIIKRLVHLLLPHESNNQKAKLLHNSSLSLLILVFVGFQLLLDAIPRVAPRILGYAANISADEVINLTNEKRIQNGLAPLKQNSTLSAAAQAKGIDMLNKNYWAHTAPDGTQPWKFFVDFGYKYRYAGENLARDFSNASSAVDAWMASPSHRSNILSSKYKEIGIGIVEGDMDGVETTIIVQFFGTPLVDTLPIAPVAQTNVSTPTPMPQPLVLATPVPTVQPSPTPTALTIMTPAPQKVLISPFITTKDFSLAVVGLLILVLIIDGLITNRRRIVRIGGRTFAHLAFLGMILAIILILRAGRIM